MKEFDLNGLVERAVHGWRTPLALAVLFPILMLLSLHGAEPVYRVDMTVVPAPSDQSAPTENGGGLAVLFGLSGNLQGGPNYARYRALLTSTVVASRLSETPGLMQQAFKGIWNAKTNRWEEPDTLRADLQDWLVRWSNIAPWSPPDATLLSQYLQLKLLIVPSTTSDIVHISMDDRDPAFAARLMLMAHKQANIVLRDQVARRARLQVAYLQSKLADTTVTDYRATLLGLLSAEEKTLMLTQTDADFAAEILSPPLASPTPVSPRPVLSMLVALLVGLLTGMAVVIFLGPEWWRAPMGWFQRKLNGGLRGKKAYAAPRR